MVVISCKRQYAIRLRFEEQICGPVERGGVERLCDGTMSWVYGLLVCVMCPRGFDGGIGSGLQFYVDVLNKMQVAPFGCNAPIGYVEKSSALSPWANQFFGWDHGLQARGWHRASWIQ